MGQNTNFAQFKEEVADAIIRFAPQATVVQGLGVIHLLYQFSVIISAINYIRYSSFPFRLQKVNAN